MGPDESVLLFELLNDSLPPLRRHNGPPLWEAENADQFRGKYCGYPAGSYFSGPFIDEGLYFIEVPRRYCRAADLLRSGDVLAVGLGKHVRRAMEDSCSLFAGPECWSHDRSAFLSAFFSRSSPLVRIRRGGEHCPPPSSPDRGSGPEK
jgi:tRNA nucleotidyltransferase (CCA-adding enzyme)